MRLRHIPAYLLLICLPFCAAAESMPVLPEDRLRGKGMQEIDVSEIPATALPAYSEIHLESAVCQGEAEVLSEYRREPGIFMG